jgi:hypothetical protein
MRTHSTLSRAEHTGWPRHHRSRKTQASVVALFFICLSFTEAGLLADTISASSIQSTVLEEGDAYIHGFAYFEGYLWASTRTKPCRVLRIDPKTLSYERILLDEDAFEGEDLITAAGSIWIILYGPPTRIVRLDPETLRLDTVVEFGQDELTRGGALEHAFGALWAGGGNGKFARIDLTDFSYEVFDYTTALGRLQIHALTDGGGYLWASSPLYRKSETTGNESIVLRINPRCPTEYAAVFLRNMSVSDDMVYRGGRLYAGSEEGGASLISIANDLTYHIVREGETGCNGIFAQGKILWGAFSGEPGRLLRYNPESASYDTLTLPEGCNHANEVVFNPEGSSIYISCWESPAKIVRVDLSPAEGPNLIYLVHR